MNKPVIETPAESDVVFDPNDTVYGLGAVDDTMLEDASEEVGGTDDWKAQLQLELDGKVLTGTALDLSNQVIDKRRSLKHLIDSTDHQPNQFEQQLVDIDGAALIYEIGAATRGIRGNLTEFLKIVKI